MLSIKTNRDEIITSDPMDKRELTIKAWYPADVTTEKREKYLPSAEREGFAIKYGLPKKTFGYLDLTATNTYENPPVAEGKYPVLIFSHGYYSKASGYYAIIEDIVSQGYIVINLNHTCLLYTSPSPRDKRQSRMPSSA